jgi:hypothetical protein
MKRPIPTPPQKYDPTSKFAATLGVKPDTVRRSLCVNGHFLGIKPLKMPNGRLLWPRTHPEQLV